MRILQQEKEKFRAAMSGVKHLKAEHAQQIAEQKKSVEAAKAKAEKAHQEFRDKRREGHKDSIADHSRKPEVEEREVFLEICSEVKKWKFLKAKERSRQFTDVISTDDVDPVKVLRLEATLFAPSG